MISQYSGVEETTNEHGVAVYVNRYAFTNYGPAQIWTQRKLTTAQARKIFAKAGLEVTRFVPNWAHFIGWVGIIELTETGLVHQREETLIESMCPNGASNLRLKVFHSGEAA